MSNKIKTAEELINKWHRPLNKLGDIASIQLIEAMKEYAEQFIDLAAKEATITEESRYYIVVDKESILKVKQLIK